MNRAEVARLARAVESLRIAHGSIQNSIVCIPTKELMESLIRQGRELSITLRYCEQALQYAIQEVESASLVAEQTPEGQHLLQQLKYLDADKSKHDG